MEGKGRQGYCFEAPETLRLIGTWLVAAPEDMDRLKPQSEADESVRWQYGTLKENVRSWAKEPPAGRGW